VIRSAVALRDPTSLTDVALVPAFGEVTLKAAGAAFVQALGGEPDFDTVAFVLDAVQALESLRRTLGSEPMVAPATLRAVVVARFGKLPSDLTRAEAMLRQAELLEVLGPADRIHCLAALIAATPEDAGELPARIGRLLAEPQIDPAACAAAAPRVFATLCAREDWDGAFLWASAAGARGASAELVQRVRRVVVFRDLVRTWVDQQVPVVKHSRYLVGSWRNRADVPLRFALRVDAVDGFTLRGTVLLANRQTIPVSGKIGDESLKLDAGPARNGAYRFVGTRLTVDRGLLGTLTLSGGDQRPGEELVRYRLFPPADQCVMLDSLTASRDLRGNEDLWPTQGGGKEMVLPLFFRGVHQPVTWTVGAVCALGDRTLKGTLLVDEQSKNLAQWRAAQGKLRGNPKKAGQLARLEIQVDQGQIVSLPFTGDPLAISVPISRGARIVSINAEGTWPAGGPILECPRLVK
jgi:hypothetical protein